MSDLMRKAAELVTGRPGDLIGFENRERVRDYFANHIGATNIECAKALDLSVYAVGRHVEKLRQEWTRP